MRSVGWGAPGAAPGAALPNPGRGPWALMASWMASLGTSSPASLQINPRQCPARGKGG